MADSINSVPLRFPPLIPCVGRIMQSTDWIELFSLIPPEQHNTLILMTQSRIELSVEQVLRLEPTYVAIRGRLCGSTDDGRVFFIPYAQLTYVNINRYVKEEEIRSLYGDSTAEPWGRGTLYSPDGLTEAENDQGIAPSVPAAPGAGNGSPRPATQPQNVRPHGPPPGAVPTATRQPVAPATNGGVADPSATPRANILERLRSQRSAMTPKR